MDFVEEIFGKLGDWFSDVLNSTVGNWLGGIFGGLAKSLIHLGDGIYNKLIGDSIDLLKQSPESWNGGSGWNVISSVNSVFVAVGASLLIIFWLIGIISMSIDERMNVRIEVMIKEMIKLVVAEAVVTCSINIIQTFFGLVDKLTSGFIPTAESVALTIPDDVSSFLDNGTISLNDGALCLLVGIFFVVGTIAAGGTILYLAYVRFFKVLLIIPYGAIASSTMVGGPAFSHSAASYYKYALSTVLEAVTMLLAIKISSAIISSDAINIVTNEGGTTGTTVTQWMVRSLIMLFVTLGAVKESSQITQRGLGL